MELERRFLATQDNGNLQQSSVPNGYFHQYGSQNSNNNRHFYQNGGSHPFPFQAPPPFHSGGPFAPPHGYQMPWYPGHQPHPIYPGEYSRGSMGFHQMHQMHHMPQNERFPPSIHPHRQRCGPHDGPMYHQYQSHSMPEASYPQGVGRHPQHQQHHPAAAYDEPRVPQESDHPLIDNDTSIPPAPIPAPPVDHAVMTRSSSTTVTEPSSTKQEDQEPKDTSGSGNDDQEDSNNHNPPSGKGTPKAYGSGGGGGGSSGGESSSDSESESSDAFRVM